MKISDEQLQAFIELLECAEPKSDEAMQNIIPLAIGKELQQLREERRWRKLGVDELKTSNPYQVFYGGHIDYEVWEWIGDDVWIYGDVDNAKRRHVASLTAKHYEDFAFRPLPMDLPEVE